MKKFTETYKIENKVSLEGLEEQVQEKFKDIDGKIIDECCCCGCTTCCSDVECGEPVWQGVPNYPFKYYNEQEIIKKLETDVTVQDIISIKQQFNCGVRFSEVRDMINNSPLYFEEKLPCYGSCDTSSGVSILNASKNLYNNKQVYNFINKLMKENGLCDPIVYSTIDGRNIVYFLKHTGTNGKEASIKNSLLEIYEMLNKIEEYPEVKHTSVSHVSIDAADDVYAFLVRVSLDNMFVLNTNK